MDLHQLEAFARVVETRSFSRAARALGVTQSTVSERVRLLEAQLGVRLFDRLGRETLPTRAGEVLHGYAARMLALRAEAREALDRLLDRVSGALVVGASTIPGEYVLPPLVGRFRERFPQVTVVLRIADSREIAAAVLEGEVELGVVGARPEHRHLEATPLLPDDLVAIVPPGHPWFGQAQATLEELVAQPVIVREAGSGSREALERALEAAGSGLQGLQVVAEIGSTSAVKQAVKAGVGISIVSRRAVEEECRHALLGCVRIAGLEFARQFYLVLRSGRARSPLCEAFVEFLRALEGRDPPPSLEPAAPPGPAGPA